MFQTRPRTHTLTHPQRQLPDVGWDDTTIELFLSELAVMDSNNFVDNVGVGEREARIFSSLVARRHYHFGHGIGRSGDLMAQQPKAAGSSLIYQLTTLLALHALKLSGVSDVKHCIVLPCATGMAHVHTLLALKKLRIAELARMRQPQQPQQQATPSSQPTPTPVVQPVASGSGGGGSGSGSGGGGGGPRYVLWPRIDQKTCLKAITSAGFIPIVIEGVIERSDIPASAPSTGGGGATVSVADEVRTNLPLLESEIKRVGSEQILCVLSTASCFAPRAPDRLVEIGVLCARYNIPHIVNNAYGLQTANSTQLLMSTIRKRGRIDAFIQSTDKNFMVPVGGSIVAAFGRTVNKSQSQAATPKRPKQREQKKPLPATAATGGGDGKTAAPHTTATATTTTTDSKPDSKAPAGVAAVAAPSLPVTANSVSGGCGFGPELIDTISSEYPGRAGISPILDLLITLLSMGVSGYQKLLSERQRLFDLFKTKLAAAAATAGGERLLHTPNNHISLALSLSQLMTPPLQQSALTATTPVTSATPTPAAAVGGAVVVVPLSLTAASGDVKSGDVKSRSSSQSSTSTIAGGMASPSSSHGAGGGGGGGGSSNQSSYLGSLLFSRCVSGTRVVSGRDTKSIAGITFQGWGAHTASYPVPYLTAAVAIGVSESELDTFLVRLNSALDEFRAQRTKRLQLAAAANPAPPTPPPSQQQQQQSNTPDRNSKQSVSAATGAAASK